GGGFGAGQTVRYVRAVPSTTTPPAASNHTPRRITASFRLRPSGAAGCTVARPVWEGEKRTEAPGRYRGPRVSFAPLGLLVLGLGAGADGGQFLLGRGP